MTPPRLEIDADQIARFFNGMFRHADEGTFLSLRAFAQNDRAVPPIFIRASKLNGSGSGPIIATATKAAQDAADSPIAAVFAPPVATFSNGARARGVDLANDVCLSVEIDENPAAGRRRLEGLLGPCTFAVESGSEWMDPETGELQPKLHLHWRLSEATRTDEEHDRVRLARSIATRLIGADPTGVPAVHPLRWPGSWNVKTTPRMCRIVAENLEAEIHLGEALETLQDTQEESGWQSFGETPRETGSPRTAPPGMVSSALMAIPNDGVSVHYGDWVRMGYACRNTLGDETGFELWDAWSQKSDKYEAGFTTFSWTAIVAACKAPNPPRKMLAGTIFHIARQAGWTRPEPEPPPDIDDPGYYDSMASDREAGGERQKSKAKPEQEPGPLPPLMPLAAFMDTFTNPDYVVDGILQRGRLQALTSPTGHGKTAAAVLLSCYVAGGKDIGNIEVAQGDVVFLAGENSDDVCGRFWAACQFYGMDRNQLPIRVMPDRFPLDDEAALALRAKIEAGGHQTTLIILDSCAAYFAGEDDNANVPMGDYARSLRLLTKCAGNPSVLILSHPVKHAPRDNLLPRGGGAFLNELDANLTMWADAQGEVTTLHWQGKIRGADFQPLHLSLQPVKMNGLADRKGRPFVSIIATLQTDEQAEKATTQNRSDENIVLAMLRRQPGISLAKMAKAANWVNDKNGPNKAKVQRLLGSLKDDKLVKLHRGKYVVTDAGKAELKCNEVPDC